MIKPTDIGVTTMPDVFWAYTIFTAGIKCSAQGYKHSSEPERDVGRECQAEVWDGIYGDIERKLPELRHNLLREIVPHGGDFGALDRVNKLIDELESMVRNPFSCPPPAIAVAGQVDKMAGKG